MPPHISVKSTLKEKLVKKAAKAENDARKKELLDMGLTKAMKKAIKEDEIICTKCKATKKGPTDKCSCKGGPTKPTEDFNIYPILIAAAEARHKAQTLANKAEATKHQASVASAREKEKLTRALDEVLLGEGNELQGDENYTQFRVVFEAGKKLGFSLEGNCVAKINEEQLKAHGDITVKVGWAINAVGSTELTAPYTKESVMKKCAAAMKKGDLNIRFMEPLDENDKHCVSCNKFRSSTEYFDADELAKGPGKQMCCECAEFADMGMF